MITAGLLPACAAVWHRGVFELVQAGWWQDLPGADRWAPAVWLGIPAVLLTLVAVAAAALSRVRILIVVLALATVVQPVLTLVLAPLALAVRTWPPRQTLVWPAIVALAIWAAGFWLTPACVSGPPRSISAMEIAVAWGRTIGVAGGVLIVLDLLFRHTSRRSQLAAAVVLAIVAGLLVSGRATDAPALLGASVAVLWWRVVAGASQVIEWQTTVAGRVGAIALVVLVPVLAAEQATLSPAGRGDPGTAAAWSALEAAGSPAAVMATGGRADTATTIWRSGPSDHQRSLALIQPDQDATSRYVATSAVFGWSGQARTLSMRGMLVAPLPPGGKAEPLLWRVLQFERCHALTSRWADIGGTAAGGQFAGVFPEAMPSRAALVYLGSARRLDPRPLDWPVAAGQAFDSQIYDRESADDQGRLTEALAADAFSASALGEARFVTRVRFYRRPMASDTLAVTLGGLSGRAWARLYSERDARADRQPLLCRSSVGQPITAYAGAPAVLDIDLTSPYAIGSGWYGAEQVGESRFRWTAEPEADVLFVAQRAQPLVLRLDAQPGSGSWAAAAMRVSLNGVEAQCRGGPPPCDWLLPAEAMRTGLNVITLHSTMVQAPAPDPRRLGLLVTSAQLARP